MECGSIQPSSNLLPYGDPNEPQTHLVDYKLSRFLFNLISESNPTEQTSYHSPPLQRKVKSIDNLLELKEKKDQSSEKNRLEFEIITSISDSLILSDREKIFCIKLIQQYLLAPGYKSYQAFCRSLWLMDPEGINLKTIKGFVDGHVYEINKLKDDSEARLERFSSFFPILMMDASELHTRLLKETTGELPSFNRDSLHVSCTFDQLEFALIEAQKKFGNFIAQANESHDSGSKAFITKLFQIILCGNSVTDQPLQTGSVCFLLRESLGRPLPNALLTDLDSCKHMVADEFPVKSEHFCFSLVSEGGNTTCRLLVSWETPRRMIEELVAFLVDPDSKSHAFTHPLTGRNLNAFADLCADKFSSLLAICLKDKTNSKTMANLSPDETSALEKSITRSFEQLKESKMKICSVCSDADRIAMGAFVLEFFGIFTSASSVEDFQLQIRQLMKNKEYPNDFLAKILSFIDAESHNLLLTLAIYHIRFRKNYEKAIATALNLYTACIQKAFSDAPKIDETTGVIEVSYERFRAGLTLFNKSFKWMIQFASTNGELALANHILSYILCGKDVERIYQVQCRKTHCFLIKEFNHTQPCLSQSVSIMKGMTCNQYLFDEIESVDSSLSEKDQFQRTLGKVGSLFIFDGITRNNYEVQLGNQIVMTRELRLFPLILENYIAFLEQHPAQANAIRNTPFYQLFQTHFNLELFFTYLTNQNNAPLITQFKDNLYLFLKSVPEYLQGLVYLKMMELMCILNQGIFVATTSVFRNLINQHLGEKESPFEVFFGSQYDYYFTFSFPNIDAVTCEGFILSYLIAENLPNSILERIYPLQIRLRYHLPSLCQWIPEESPPVPTLETTELRFSAISPVEFLEFMACEMNASLVETIHKKWDLDRILTEFNELKVTIQTTGNKLLKRDRINLDVIQEVEALFHDLFEIQNKLIIWLKLLDGQKEKRKILINMEGELKIALKILQKIYKKLKNENPSSPIFITFKSHILNWFPQI